MTVNTVNTALQPGESLVAGRGKASTRTSEDGKITLIMQTDGNLVLYALKAAYWASGTQGSGGHICTMQNDGNLVVYDRHNHAVWATGTEGHPGTLAFVNDSGALQLYYNGSLIWSSLGLRSGQQDDRLSFAQL